MNTLRVGLILSLIIGVIVAVLCLVGIIFNPHGFWALWGDVHDGLGQALHAAAVGVVILFFAFLGLAVAYGVIRLRQMNRVQAVGPTKHGPQQAVIVYSAHGPQVNHLSNNQMPLDMGQVMQILERSLQMNATVSTMTQRLTQVREVDTEEIKQIAPPAHAPQVECIHISDEYQVPADDALSGRKLIVGISGSGKSNTIGVYGEELGQLKVPLVLGDTEDEYRLLGDHRWLPNGVLAGADAPYRVDVENAEDFGRYVLTHRLQVILNLQSYEMEEAALVMIGIISGMRKWEEALPNDERIPSEFILEEAVTWLPQNVKESPLHGTDTFAALQGTFFNDMVRKGRKRGLGLTVVCQKIAELDNRAMQSDMKLLHRQTEEADLARYLKMGITREETLSLANGDAFLFTGRVSKMRIHVRRRNSPHGANTPGLENLRRHQIGTKSVTEIPENFGRNGEISGESGTHFDQPTEPFQNISAFRRPENVPSKRAESGIPEMLRKEIEERYLSGMNRTGIRDDLELNGDQYWMIRVVCDECDRKQKVKEV